MTTGIDRDELVVLVAEEIVRAEWLRVTIGHGAEDFDATGQSDPVKPAPRTVRMTSDASGGLVALPLDDDERRHTTALTLPRALATQRSPPHFGLNSKRCCRTTEVMLR